MTALSLILIWLGTVSLGVAIWCLIFAAAERRHLRRLERSQIDLANSPDSALLSLHDRLCDIARDNSPLRVIGGGSRGPDAPEDHLGKERL